MHAGLPPRSGPRVASRGSRGVRVDAACLPSGAQGVLHALARHGGGCRGQRDPAPARRRNKPHRVAVGFPGLAEPLQGLVGQRHRAVLGPVATAHVDKPAGTLPVGNLQVGALWQAQATGVNRRQTGPLPRQPPTREARVHCLEAEDDRQLVRLRWSHEGQGGPCPLEGILVEERATAEGDGAGAA